MLPNIVLIGFMGCGKSSVGRRIAGNTSLRFVDTDELVVTRTGKSISQIFADSGEDYFRDLESQILAELADQATGIVLATGGGIILQEKNRAILKRIGPIIWLDADPDLLFERVSRNKKRPLLQNKNPRETFDRLLFTRRPVYQETADLYIDSTGLSHEETARIVMEEALRLIGRNRAKNG